MLRLCQGELDWHLALLAQTAKNQARKQWMVDHLQLRGSVTVDEGAADQSCAMEGKSLLPIGMTAVQGDFARGDVIAIRAADEQGREIARGLANYASAEARLICRKASGEFESGCWATPARPEMVHRTNLVLSALERGPRQRTEAFAPVCLSARKMSCGPQGRAGVVAAASGEPVAAHDARADWRTLSCHCRIFD